MTDLERQLMAALERLSVQYKIELRWHAEQVEALQQRVERQAEQSETLQRQFERLDGQMTRLAELCGDVRREIERPLDLTRPRGRERDSGPSR